MTQERDTANKIVALLDEGAAALDDTTVAELTAARWQALQAMSRPVHVSNVELAHGGMGRFIFQHLFWHRAWVLPVIMLAIGLMVVALLHHNAATAPFEADALLLASDLPPEAYIDQGFDAWLENSSRY